MATRHKHQPKPPSKHKQSSPRKVCAATGKGIYNSERQARDGLGWLLRNRFVKRPDDYALTPYSCTHCGGWHYGHHVPTLKIIGGSEL